MKGHERWLHGGVSPPLRYPPEEVARFWVADWLREAAEAGARVRRLPGFVPAPAHAPVRWNPSPDAPETNAVTETPADYRHQRLLYGPVGGSRFLLSYLGLRTAGQEPPQAVFTLEVFPDGHPRYRPVAADAQYLAVDAGRGGPVVFTVAGHRYRARIGPPARGFLMVENLGAE